MSLIRLLAIPVALAVTLPLGAAASPHPRHDDSAAAAAVSVAWQRIAMRTIFTEGGKPPQTGTLYLAFVSLAVYDAAQDSLGRRANSRRAAVATAAHDVLLEYFPASGANLDADLDASLAAVPDGPAEAKGIRIGAEAADELVATRVGDHRDDATVVYTRDRAAGVWQPPEGGAMATAWLGFVHPLIDVRPVPLDGPDSLDSDAYAADFEEVRTIGSNSPATMRSGPQTDIARFFAFNPPLMYRTALCGLLESAPMGLEETTRMFATIDVAVANTMIETFRLKFDVGYWRPFQAIAGAADDGNPMTEPETGWTPLVANPAYSDYTSGHAAATAPFAEILRRTFGDAITIRLSNPTLGIVRDYTSLTTLESDALNARIWGGLHFRDAMDDGYDLGHRVARRVDRALD